ncbi:MAG: 1-(5-phosphoribosyl)-5-[(5-phosphoribosylamino)methylideneamino]imidazole-4-carboxamide isomerase [Oscillospiraceae bacterium]|nr:1-(5-phosphoribosyl)-5-[(5-phosphoribosylamino)methylideneamino]imidazole-4-carboxamide isomerase [Oscillospiraceae bacterium]
MIILPAIDLYEGKAVRLLRGDYAQMTVYSDSPLEVSKDFQAAGAEYIHMVDLAGARDGDTPNFDIVAAVAAGTDLKVEVGGGIRSEAVIRRYLDVGVERVILGTAAITDWDFFREMVEKYGSHIAAGADCRDGYVAIKGWLETSAVTCGEFCGRLDAIGVKTLICTDISKDGAMGGANRALYSELSARYSMDIIASGGVSSLEDIQALRDMGLHGAILGRAYYTGAVKLREAIEVAL